MISRELKEDTIYSCVVAVDIVLHPRYRYKFWSTPSPLENIRVAIFHSLIDEKR